MWSILRKSAQQQARKDCLTNTLAYWAHLEVENKMNTDPGTIFRNFIFFVTYYWANMLECHITPGWEGLTLTKTLACWARL
jgi:hypothetical protein